jgi:hypothetical protein
MIGRNGSGQPHTGLLVEVSHYTTDFMMLTLHQVLREYNTGELAHNLIAGVVDALPLYGDDLIASWQQEAAHYPRELAAAVVEKYGVIDHFWRWEMYLHRSENLPLIYQAFAQAHHRLLHTLLGLNRVYYFGFKWIDVVDARLRLKPDNFLSRLRDVYKIAPDAGAQQTIELVEETFNFIETHLPDVNVGRLREIFRYRRPVWDHAPLDFENKVE